MRFYETNIKNLDDMLDKLERFFAYKYEVQKKAVAIIFKEKVMYVLIDGKVKESMRPSTMLNYGIDEQTFRIVKVNPAVRNG